MKRTLRSMLVVTLGLFGCGDGGGPAEPEVQPQTVFFSYACETWTRQPDPNALVLADLLGESRTALEPAVWQAGGRVIHRFQLPLLRVAIRAGDIPGLPGIDFARGVTDPASLDVPMSIIYSRPVTEADMQRLRDAGASQVVYFAHPGLHYVGARVPDTSIPAVRQFDGVARLDPDVFLCSLDLPPTAETGARRQAGG